MIDDTMFDDPAHKILAGAFNAHDATIAALDKVVNGNCEDIDKQATAIFALQEKATGAVINMKVFQEQIAKLTERVDVIDGQQST